MEVEKRSFDYIPEEERHGKPRSLFNIWFSANMQIAVLVTGGLAVTLG
ncbi:MAG TPA: cytosine permease, partial [Pseudogracilibacillus sp.]|nr:cytosine permease [Pseudogracilibacillus sp.]